MIYQVEISKNASKQLSKLAPELQKGIQSNINNLALPLKFYAILCIVYYVTKRSKLNNPLLYT